MAEIQDKYKKLFNPYFNASINGKQKMLSPAEVTQNWQKYVKSSVGYIYKDRKKLIATLESGEGKTKPDPVKLNMAQAQRGSTFAQTRGIANSQPSVKEELAKLQKRSERKRARLKADLEQRTELKKQIKSAKSEATKAKNKLKKATETASEEQGSTE